MDSHRAYSYLRKAILLGELKPRERLVESDLAERIGVSRTPIREALRGLAEQGLVQIFPHRGAVVSDLSPEEVENIHAVRICLEVFASRLALSSITPERLKEISGLEAACARLASGRDILALIDADERFHDAIYATARNPRLLEIIRQLRQRIAFVRFIGWSIPDRVVHSVAEHRQMVHMLHTQDRVRLLRLTRSHIQVAKDVYLAHLASGSPGLLDRGRRTRMGVRLEKGRGGEGRERRA